MTVPATTAAGAGTASNGASSKAGGPSAASVDYQSFLRLLVAEMKNQDPTNPIDSTQYVSQLATFSQVEQTVQVNNKLASLLQSSAVAQADALLGRLVTSADGSVKGTVASVKLTSDGAVAVLTGGAEIAIEAGITVQ